MIEELHRALDSLQAMIEDTAGQRPLSMKIVNARLKTIAQGTVQPYVKTTLSKVALYCRRVAESDGRAVESRASALGWLQIVRENLEREHGR